MRCILASHEPPIILQCITMIKRIPWTSGPSTPIRFACRPCASHSPCAPVLPVAPNPMLPVGPAALISLGAGNCGCFTSRHQDSLTMFGHEGVILHLQALCFRPCHWSHCIPVHRTHGLGSCLPTFCICMQVASL